MKLLSAILAFSACVSAQTLSLISSAPTVEIGGSVTLSLTGSADNVSRYHWVLSLPPGVKATPSLGPSAALAKKKLSCNGLGDRCMIYGEGATYQTPMPAGEIAKYTIQFYGERTEPKQFSIVELTAFSSGEYSTITGMSVSPPIIVQVVNPLDLNGDGVVDEKDVAAARSRTALSKGKGNPPNPSRIEKYIKDSKDPTLKMKGR